MELQRKKVMLFYVGSPPFLRDIHPTGAAKRLPVDPMALIWWLAQVTPYYCHYLSARIPSAVNDVRRFIHSVQQIINDMK
jgi:hypothetical protein